MPRVLPKAVLARIVVAGNLNRLEPYFLTACIIGFALAVNVLVPYISSIVTAVLWHR